MIHLFSPAVRMLITSHPPSAVRMLQARQAWLTGHVEQARQLAFEAREHTLEGV